MADFSYQTQEAIAFIKEALDRPVVLTGMMGSGKTQIGRRLACMLDLPFYDSDHIVEQRAGYKVAEVFEVFGEAKFREAEKNAILNALHRGVCVIATGGGAVTDPQVREALRHQAIAIWLNSDIAEIKARLGDAESRPLLKRGDAETVLHRLMESREAFYRQAPIRVDNAATSTRQASEATLKALYAHLKQDRS